MTSKKQLPTSLTKYSSNHVPGLCRPWGNEDGEDLALSRSSGPTSPPTSLVHLAEHCHLLNGMINSHCLTPVPSQIHSTLKALVTSRSLTWSLLSPTSIWKVSSLLLISRTHALRPDPGSSWYPTELIWESPSQHRWYCTMVPASALEPGFNPCLCYLLSLWACACLHNTLILVFLKWEVGIVAEPSSVGYCED